MRAACFLIAIILLLALLPAGVTALGNISVSSSPTGATVYVDSVSQGTTPLTIYNLTTGSHGVLLQSSGYVSNTTTVPIEDGITTALSVTLAANAPTVASLTPPYGYNSSTISISSIVGTGFSGTPGVVLNKTGQANIVATGVVLTGTTSIACTFDITNRQAGNWNVVVTNPDGQSATLANGFEVKSSSGVATLSSISPSSAVTNTTVSVTNLAGTGFIASPLPQIYLKRSQTNDLYGSVTSATTTSIVGTFNLTNRVPGSYQVCVINSASDAVCGLTFTINPMSTSLANGTISFTSTPSSATVYVDSVKKGTTPFTLYNVTPGSYAIKVLMSGYLDWANRVTVTAGNQTSVSATLTAVDSSSTTVATTLPTVTTATLPPTTKRTIATPTPWPSDTPASPVEVPVLIGAVALGLVLLRKH